MANPEFLSFRPPSPDRPEAIDVGQLEACTKALRGVDYQRGGGMCRDAVIVQIRWGHQMLGMTAADPLRERLFTAVADLHNLAGWTCFDSGHFGDALHHFDLALDLAEQGHNDDLSANVHYRRGRVHLHYGAVDQALTHFQLGQLAARRSGSKLATSMLSVNQAWAFAKKGEAEVALGLLGRAQEEFADAEGTESPDWARFFTSTDLTAMVGTIQAELALTVSDHHAGVAIPALTEAVADFGPDMARSRAFCLISLATSHLLDGDVHHGATIGTRAVHEVESLKSIRAKDRLRPLKLQADQRRDQPEARALSDFITSFIAGPTHV
jgi:tetratricopeptide (TPR) repeat protein